MSGISCLLGTPEAQAKIRAWYQAQLAKPVPWDGKAIDHGKEILLVRGPALMRLCQHPELGVQTSHDLLRLMQKQYTANGGKEGKDEKGNTVWTFGPAQVEIMEKLGMFKRSDFVVVTFENLESFPYSVLSYTWNDSKWRELVLALQKLLPGMLEEGEEEEFFWLDIFCLDQFKADKMKSIFRSNEIYGWAVKYYVMGLAIFDRVWCLAETTCIGEKAQRRKEMIMVTDVEGFLRRREDAYMRAKLGSNPRFNGSRCTVESDREIVEKRILESGFVSVHDFDVYIKEVADKKMSPIRQVSHQDAQHATAPQSRPASACDSVC